MVTTLLRPLCPVLIGLTCFTIGCGRKPVETSVDVLDGVKYRIVAWPGASTGGGSSRNIDASDAEVYTWDGSEWKVEISVARPKAPAENFRSNVKVDGCDYGGMKPGDDVIINVRQPRRVTVNGSERKAKPR